MEKQGITLISLIITIVAIIILATVSLYSGFMANFTRFTSDIDELRVELRSIKNRKF